jgi:hypothetical protein
MWSRRKGNTANDIQQLKAPQAYLAAPRAALLSTPGCSLLKHKVWPSTQNYLHFTVKIWMLSFHHPHRPLPLVPGRAADATASTAAALAGRQAAPAVAGGTAPGQYVEAAPALVGDADLEALGDARPVGAVRLKQRQQRCIFVRRPETLQGKQETELGETDETSREADNSCRLAPGHKCNTEGFGKADEKVQHNSL